MTTAETLRALLALVEEAKGPDRRLDYEIFVAFAEPGQSNPWDPNVGHLYATSIDAALALVAKVLPGWIVERMSDQASGHVGALKPFGAHVELENGEKTAIGQAASRPLAILAALLRALLQQSETAHVER